VLSVIFLKERLNWRQMTGIAVATGGILLLVSRGKLAELDWLQSVGDWLILASAHTWAVYTIITRDLSRTHRPLVVTFVILAFSSILFIMWMVIRTDWGAVLSMPLQAKAAIGFLGVICTGVAFWLWQEAVARMGAASAGFYLYLEPLATTLLAVPYLNESFGLWSAVGGVCVLAGVFIAEKRRRPSTGH
jgi:drug/metabolite transporter (DMT)-like permease